MLPALSHLAPDCARSRARPFIPNPPPVEKGIYVLNAIAVPIPNPGAGRGPHQSITPTIQRTPLKCHPPAPIGTYRHLTAANGTKIKLQISLPADDRQANRTNMRIKQIKAMGSQKQSGPHPFTVPASVYSAYSAVPSFIFLPAIFLPIPPGPPVTTHSGSSCARLHHSSPAH
jgi:hypothetical protein